MIVCIAEKPSVAREIAKVLGANTSHDGYMEGNGYQVTWTFGHLCCLKEPHDYFPQWRRWSVSALPMIPPRFGIKLIDNQGYEKQFHVIERLMQAADGIVNCGDAGQEGELIQRWVMQKAKATCPVQRLWVSSLTEEAIREAFANLKPQSEYQSLYEAGLCRAIGDWLLGMNATRLYSIKYGHDRQILSIGRVQTPTLAMIVKRHFEIKDFKPEKYWVLSTIYRGVVFTSTKGKIKGDQWPAVSGMLEELKKNDFEVTDIQQKAGTEAPPRLFDLTSLQVECNKKYSFTADDTLRHIQSLYEKKLTTYPRVDTTYLSEDVYARCPAILQGIRPYAPLIQPLMGTRLKKSKKVFDSSKVTDHHAIIPTGTDPSTTTLSLDEKRVFDLVARRFIAVFYPDCKFSTTTVMGETVRQSADAKTDTSDKQKQTTIEFKATGKQILDEGWRVVFGGRSESQDNADSQDNQDSQDKEQTLPHFDKGEHGPHEPQLTEKQTTPPKPYTEATLLRAMETAGKTVDNEELRDALKANGIGRPSTRAAIIETLFKRQYIRRVRKSLEPTQTGIDLIGTIHQELLKSAELTGQWEKKLRDIEAHRYSAAQFIEELKQMVCEVVATTMSQN
ncbi:MAG: DNA topoisomerase 3 [Bacteroidales bacterium]|nr:DNA topoisomerase 3 [Bacteroidales bacterium]